MIGKLKGIVDSVGDDFFILDVGGVGYLIHSPVRVLASLPPIGEFYTIYIETYVREDMIRLYGFSHQEEKEWFRLLMTVQGVGAKVALAILGVLDKNELASAISLQDKTMISRAPGVGKKVADRILSELKDKIPAFALQPNTALSESLDQTSTTSFSSQQKDAISALVNLGYSEMRVRAIITSLIAKGEQENTENLIRKSLKELSS